MKSLLLSLLLFSCFIFPEDNIVLVISMDGLRHDYPEKSQSGGFSLMSSQGLKAESLIPVYQSTTYPAHVSMATGVHPDKHGILHNSFYDKEKGLYSYSPEANWIQIKPIWAYLEEKGIKTATYFWVGSETAWNGIEITYSKFPFSSRVSEKTKIQQIIDWLSLPDNERPRLIMSWWHGIDSTAHKHGITNKKVSQSFAKQDQYLLDLINKIKSKDLWKKVTMIVLSDHGMTDISNLINVNEILKKANIKAKVSIGPAVGHIFLEDQNDLPNAVKILKQNKSLDVKRKNELDESLNLFHPTRTGDIVILTKSPNMLVSRKNSNPPIGMHGYNPKLNKDMEGIFFAYGNKINPIQIGKVKQVDVAPTILSLLEVDIPEYMEGKEITLN
ncbi:MAG: alkaline phosphatase family protein [SAR86 cluster bacterium]|nr:alkaline phosphatase family protein [SAR86 cluster bacterium]